MTSVSSPSSANAQNPQTDISLGKLLDELEAEANFPATDLIKELLKFHRADTTHERNIHLAAQVFTRSRAAYAAINGLIQEVDERQELDFTSWERYTDAIPPLEEILLQYCFNKPDKQRKHVPKDEDDVDGGLIFIDVWAEDRKMLKSTLNGLNSGTLTALSEEAKAVLSEAFEDERTSDDQVTLSALLNHLVSFTAQSQRLKDNDITDKRRGEKPVTDINNLLGVVAKKLASKPPSETTTESIIKTLMITAIPYSLLDKQRSSKLKKLENDVRDHLASMKVWNAMKSLLLAAGFVADSRPGADQVPFLKDWEKKYEALRTLLLEVGPIFVSLAEEMLELIKLSARIRSPFHERTVGLVKILRGLDVDSNKSPAQGRRELKQTMQDAITQLKTASETINKDVKQVVLSQKEYTSQAESMKTLLGKVQQTTNTLNLGSKWTESEKLFTSGVTIDENHLTRMRQVFMNATA